MKILKKNISNRRIKMNITFYITQVKHQGTIAKSYRKKLENFGYKTVDLDEKEYITSGYYIKSNTHIIKRVDTLEEFFEIQKKLGLNFIIKDNNKVQINFDFNVF